MEEKSHAAKNASSDDEERGDLYSLNLELRAVLDMNRAIGSHLDRDELFGALAACLKTLIPTERFGIELPIQGNKLQGHILSPSPAVLESTQPTILPAQGTVCNWVIENRTLFVSGSLDVLRVRFPITFDVMSSQGMESLCAMPLVSGERCRGALFFMSSAKGAYDQTRQGFLEQVASTVSVALDHSLAHEEVRQLRDRLQAENVYLNAEIKAEYGFDEIIGHSQSLRNVLRQVEQVAPTESTVLITGETGTGKELVARAIHNLSRRKERALIKVNCAALSPGLIESELFGHEKGAFTGATSTRKGRFELADGGALFLDEVGDLHIENQVRLLRVLQEQEFERVGGTQTLKVNVRVMAATNRNLEELVRSGAFRSDLYYRLSIFPIHIPPLRERIEDVPLLTDYFVQKFSRRMGKKIRGVSAAAVNCLVNYLWPGNARELANVLERAVILCDSAILQRDHIAIPESKNASKIFFTTPEVDSMRIAPTQLPEADISRLRDLERKHILKALEKSKWVVGGSAGAAKILGLNRTTLLAKMKKLGIARPL